MRQRQRQLSSSHKLRRVLSSKHLADGSKTRIVVVGSGWAGFTFLNGVDRNKYDVCVVSPSNHFLFTPLLPSSVVGTLEFRAIQEPVRTVPHLQSYFQAKATSVDLDRRRLVCTDIFKSKEFEVEYDYLLVATGAKTNTFGTPGISEREGKEVFFLKHLYHARQIRNRILECFERAAMTEESDEAERRRLLSFVRVSIPFDDDEMTD